MSFYPYNATVLQRINMGGRIGDDLVKQAVGQYIATPEVADPNGILAAKATSASVLTTVLAADMLLATMDVARVLEVLPGGTTADVAAGDVNIVGTDANGAAQTEALTFAANATTKQTTTKAFKTIVSIEFPIQDGAAATYDFGWGLGVGLGAVMTDDAMVLVALFDGTDELSSATITPGATWQQTLYLTNGTYDGAKYVRVYFMNVGPS